MRNNLKILFYFLSDDTVRDVKMFTPFVYVDVSDTVSLTLFIQTVPVRLNVSEYRVWLINNNTGKVVDFIFRDKRSGHIQHSFPVDEGVYYFKVATLHSDCFEYGCVNSTSPLISISNLQIYFHRYFSFAKYFQHSSFRTSVTSSFDNDYKCHLDSARSFICNVPRLQSLQKER